MTLRIFANGIHAHNAGAVIQTDNFGLSVSARFTSFGTGTSEILALTTDAFSSVATPGTLGVAVTVSSTGIVGLIVNDGTTVTTLAGTIALATNTAYAFAVNKTTDVWRVRTTPINTHEAATVHVTSAAIPFAASPVMTRLKAHVGPGANAYIEALQLATVTAAGLPTNFGSPQSRILAYAPDAAQSNAKRVNYIPAIRGYVDVNGDLSDAADFTKTRFYQTGTQSEAGAAITRMLLRGAKHHRLVRRIQGNFVYSAAGTRCGAPPASIVIPTISVASAASTTTTATSAAVSVDRLVSSTASTTAAASAAVTVDRIVSSTASTTATASANTVTSAAPVSSTASTITDGIGQAGSGVASSATTATGAPATTIAADYPVVSAASTATGATGRLVAPIASTAATNTGAAAGVTTTAPVASAAGTSAGASAAVAFSFAVSSAAATSAGTVAAAVVLGRAVVSIGATNTTAPSTVLGRALAVESTGAIYAGAPPAFSLGVAITATISSAYAGAADTFCRAPTAKITVGLTVPPNPRRREWPYHPR